jgi:hypothetical protein
VLYFFSPRQNRLLPEDIHAGTEDSLLTLVDILCFFVVFLQHLQSQGGVKCEEDEGGE